jgi:hypothetical protein
VDYTNLSPANLFKLHQDLQAIKEVADCNPIERIFFKHIVAYLKTQDIDAYISDRVGHTKKDIIEGVGVRSKTGRSAKQAELENVAAILRDFFKDQIGTEDVRLETELTMNRVRVKL